MLQRVFPHSQYVDNYDHARLGRIWILYAAVIRLQGHVVLLKLYIVVCTQKVLANTSSFLFFMLPMMRLTGEVFGLS